MNNFSRNLCDFLRFLNFFEKVENQHFHLCKILYFSILNDGLSLVVVVVVRAAPDIPEMSVPGVGYSFKPKGLAFVTPLYPV